jgi:D-alanyl-D-alanine carboxypeptidase
MKKRRENEKLMYIALLAFLLIASTALSFSVEKKKKSDVRAVESQLLSRNLAPIPKLTNSAEFPVLSAQGALIIDLNSMIPLYEKNPDLQLLPASTTKILTALTAMDTYNLDDVLTVGGKSTEGQRMGLVYGENITFENLLKGLLIYSANDAAEVIAENYPGGRQEFINAMNKKANDLNLTKSHFENPTGFDGGENFTTTRDLIRLSIIAMQNPVFTDIVGQKEIVITSTDERFVHRLKNTNKLLFKDLGVRGVKTGWTENARENLVTYIEKDGRKIIIALLGSQDRFGETEELMKWMFDNFVWEEVSFSKN